MNWIKSSFLFSFELDVLGELHLDLEFPQRELPVDVMSARSRNFDSKSRCTAPAIDARESSRCRRPCSLPCSARARLY